MCYSIRNVASLSSISSIINHLHLIVDGLLYLIVSPPDIDRVPIAQCAFSTLVNIVDKIHRHERLECDKNGRNAELEKFIYYIDTQRRASEGSEMTYDGSIGRKSWIRHTMAARNRKTNQITRHSSYTESPVTLRYVHSTSDSDLQGQAARRASKEEPVSTHQRDSKIDSNSKKNLHEELILHIVVSPNLKEITLDHIWFYLELISKSITQVSNAISIHTRQSLVSFIMEKYSLI